MAKYKLLGSDGDFERIHNRVCNYFFTLVEFKPEKDGLWSVHNSKGPIEGCRLVLKAGRYRFEMKSEAK